MMPQHQPLPAGTVMHKGRGLCSGCYDWADAHDCLADYPRLLRPAIEVVEEHAFLTAQGLSGEEIAERLGMKHDSVYRALYRHRARERAA
jgi:hypothetical protein